MIGNDHEITVMIPKYKRWDEWEIIVANTKPIRLENSTRKELWIVAWMTLNRRKIIARKNWKFGGKIGSKIRHERVIRS